MPGAKSAKTVMTIVAIIVIAGLIGAMMLAPTVVPQR
jgi:hypothetical protein